MLDACEADGADLAVASDGRRLQQVFLLLRARVAPSLQSYLAGGGRKVDAWFACLRVAQVDFSDEPDCFVNVNEPAERARVAAQLLSRSGAR
jgi:molybdopterin-guanine dinucleotide biosynthesis protein A